MAHFKEAYDIARALELAKLSALAMQQPDRIDVALQSCGMTLKGWYDVAETGTQAVLISAPNKNVIVFRATEMDPSNFEEACKDIRTDMRFRKVDWNGARVHRGFVEAYESIAPQVLKGLKYIEAGEPPKPLFIAGHSLGGALAKLAAIKVDRDKIGAVYTFGAPKIGDSRIDGLIGAPLYQFIHAADIVPRVPFMLFGFRHAGDKRFITRGGGIVRGGSIRMPLTFFLTALTRPSRLITDHAILRYIKPIQIQRDRLARR